MPANQFLKAQRIAAASLGLLERDIVLPSLVWRDAAGDFAGAGGDTISIRIPARTKARRRKLRVERVEGSSVIQMDTLSEDKVDVTLTDDIYSAVPTTDEELTLDISDFGKQVLAPQVRAVAEGIEEDLAATMVGATYATDLELDTVDPYNTLIDARTQLGLSNVPMDDRHVALSPDMAGIFLKSPHLKNADTAGDNSAFRDAVIGKIAGFGDIVVSNALPKGFGCVFHRTAFVLSLRAPAVPSGVSSGSSQSYNGLAMRWIKDYDFRNTQDRSLVDTFVGTNVVTDGPTDANGKKTFVRAVKLHLKAAA